VTDKFHEYLYGSKFEVKTDNNPLSYIFDKAMLDAVGHRLQNEWQRMKRL
jgi:hypothetical protein